MDLVRISSNEQIIISVKTRKLFNCNVGDKILFIKKNEKVFIKNIRRFFEVKHGNDND